MEGLVNVIQSILNALQWVYNNLQLIGEWIIKTIGVASAIIVLLPTLSKSNWFLPIVKFVGKYIALNRDPAKDEIVREALAKTESK